MDFLDGGEAENSIDVVVANHFITTHLSSLFVNWIVASTVTTDGRVNVMNRNVTHLHGGAATTIQLPDRTALRALPAEHFAVDLPEVETLRVPGLPDRA